MECEGIKCLHEGFGKDGERGIVIRANACVMTDRKKFVMAPLTRRAAQPQTLTGDYQIVLKHVDLSSFRSPQRREVAEYRKEYK